MRTFFFIVVLTTLFGCEKDDILTTPKEVKNETITTSVATTNLTTHLVTVDVPNITPQQVSLSAYHVSAMTHYENEGSEYILLSANTNPSVATIQLKKTNGSWGYLKNYPEATMGVGRNYEFVNGGIVYSDHGLEGGDPSDMGVLFYGKFNKDDIQWKRITVGNGKSFYHSVSAGDLNSDGTTDFVGLHMGIKNHDWGEPLHTFTQNIDGSIIENRNVISFEGMNMYGGGGAVLVKDLFGDGKPEIVEAEYGSREPWGEKRYGFVIFGYVDGKYKKVFELGKQGIYSIADRGATSIKSSDFNKDGKLDLAIALEGSNEDTYIQIFLNDGNNGYKPADLLEFTGDELQFREFNLIDYDNDGDMDIILNPFHAYKNYPNKFRISKENGIFLHHLIWRNDNTKFSKLTTEMKVEGIKPDYIKGYKINGVFKFIGLESNGSNTFKVHEIVPKF